MKIATWNLAKPNAKKRDGQRRILSALAADVLILTEPGAVQVDLPHVHSPLTTHNRHVPQPWVTIAGASVTPLPFELPPERMAASALAKGESGDVVIYGSVLPWSSLARHAPELSREGETAQESFARVLAAQVSDLRELRAHYPKLALVWGGDFNQSLEGDLRGVGSTVGRALLKDALESLELTAWNASSSHRFPSICSIDLLCGTSDLVVLGQGRIEPMQEGFELSDHAGYWVDVEAAR